VPLLELLFFAVDSTESTHRAKVMRVEFVPPQPVSEPRYWVRSEQVLGMVLRQLNRRTKMLNEIDRESETQQPAFETISKYKEVGVLFAEIAAPPMNLLGPESFSRRGSVSVCTTCGTA
jgi:hypothetical protein